MLDVKYVNNKEELVLLGKAGNFLNESDIRDYQWEYSANYNRVYSFDKSLTEKTLPVIFYHLLDWEHRNDIWENANLMYEIFDRDVREGTPGKLWIGDYYIDAYIVGSSKSDYSNEKIIKINFSVLSDFRWRKDVVKTFGGATPFEPGSYDVDYPHDYKYDYVPGNNIRILTSEAVAPFDFEILFQGPAEDPMVVAGGWIYRVYTILEAGEFLVVNSISKTIKKITRSGQEINEFSKRDREHYIFQKMPVSSGSTSIMWQPNHIVQITAFTERSEPKWI